MTLICLGGTAQKDPRALIRSRFRAMERVTGPVAQLDRASPSEGEGRTFESCRVRQSFQLIKEDTAVILPSLANV